MPSQKQLAKLKADFIEKRKQLLEQRVAALQLTLFDKIFTEYLSSLKVEDGNLSTDEQNYNLVHNLDKIYQQFNQTDNAGVFKTVLSDMHGIVDANITYFSNIDAERTKSYEQEARTITNKSLGLDEAGNLIKGGYAYQFIKSQAVLTAIKKITTKAIASRQDFVSFRKDLKDFITGSAETTGALQQYYRANAYDTYHKVNELTADKFADQLSLNYFIYNGGLKPTSRPFCVHYDGRIVFAPEFAALRYDELSDRMRIGIPNGSKAQGVWNPLLDRGGFNCEHQKDWITDVVANRFMSLYNQQAAEAEKAFYKNQ
jgi:hypothetical protein